jgi:hypothetical protein
LVAATGFNPFQDVTEVLAATAPDPSKPTGLVLVRGNFNVDKITALASGHAGVTVQPYDGSSLISLTDSKNNTTQALAFIGTSIAVAGDLADVQAAINRNGGPVTIDPALLARANQLSSTEDEWLASSASLASLIPANATPPTGIAAQVLPILKSIQSFGGGVDFTSNIQITGQAVTASTQNAAALAAVLQLGLNLVSMSGGNNAELKQLTEFLQTLRITANGPDVNISASIPEAQVEALLNQVLKPSTPSVATRRRPRPDVN